MFISGLIILISSFPIFPLSPECGFNPDIIIIDDGFQHISLSRDLDIVLVNSKDTQDTHKLIPAGLLREPISNLTKADLIIITKSNIHAPSNYLINKIESFNRPTIYNELQIDNLLQIKNNRINKLDKIANKKVYLFSALGDNESFKKIMDYTDAKIVGHSKYPDHYHYTLDDLNDIEEKAAKCNAEFLITTEKDLVKINPQNRKIDIYTVRMKMIFKPDKLFNEYIDNLLSKFICPAPQAKTTPTKVSMRGQPLFTNCFALGS